MEEKKPRNTNALQGEARRLVRNGGDENSCGLLSIPESRNVSLELSFGSQLNLVLAGDWYSPLPLRHRRLFHA